MTADDADGGEHDSPATERRTAPQSAFTTGDVTVGVLVALVGAAIVFLVPLLLV